MAQSPGTDARSHWPALRFETDGFRIPENRVMGRHSAGVSFLRAFVRAAGARDIAGVCAQAETGAAFTAQVRALSAQEPRARWLALEDQRGIAAMGALHLPDPQLARHARLRQSIGERAYSLTGITHTISSPGEGAMGLIADMAVGPVMPWDALICTSEAVKASVTTLLDAQDEYLRWRLGAAAAPRPDLPVIPLGVHCEDFTAHEPMRMSRRAELALADDEVAFLFLGRLSFHAKAHPYPMYVALEAAARETGKKIALIQCGWFANDFIEGAFKQGAADFAPSVRHIWLDGTKDEARQTAWAASDAFISLSDNIQETFGLTIIEAMAAGKAVIATDWDGYRQTVGHGDTGFLVPTFMPQLDAAGETYARRHAAHALTYDVYIAAASQHVSVDLRALRHAIVDVVQNAHLRGLMGARGRAVARQSFDWPVIMRGYEALWARLAKLRGAAVGEASPPAAQHLNPFPYFASYPSHGLDATTLVSLREAPDWRAAMRHALFSATRAHHTAESLLVAIEDALRPHPLLVTDLAARTGASMQDVLEGVSILAKWGALDFGAWAPD